VASTIGIDISSAHAITSTEVVSITDLDAGSCRNLLEDPIPFEVGSVIPRSATWRVSRQSVPVCLGTLCDGAQIDNKRNYAIPAIKTERTTFGSVGRLTTQGNIF
jgi:hypothetical protein